MDDHAPTGLKINIGAFRAIAAAVTEAEIGGEVAAVTITAVRPDLQLMADAVAVELTSSNGKGDSERWQTWIVAGDGRVVAHLEDPPAEPEQD
jgi:hypothetical protein